MVYQLKNEYLKKITEKTKIGYINNELVSIEEDKVAPLDEDTKVSVNLFGFTKEIFEDANEYFIEFLNEQENLETSEFYLPTVVRKSIEDNRADLKVLTTTSKFFGMTYKEDLEGLKEKINKLIQEGEYPQNLWEEQS